MEYWIKGDKTGEHGTAKKSVRRSSPLCTADALAAVQATAGGSVRSWDGPDSPVKLGTSLLPAENRSREPMRTEEELRVSPSLGRAFS